MHVYRVSVYVYVDELAVSECDDYVRACNVCTYIRLRSGVTFDDGTYVYTRV
jgi:hypothetical protein